jgi:hypothetical protein
LYFGLSVRSQPLLVSFLTVELAANSFASCAVSVSPKYGGNAYGGAVSLYIGGYSSAFESNRSAAADVGATDARNLSVTLNDAVFTACHAKRSSSLKTEFFGASVYGGSFSFYIGAYAWSRSISQSSSSKVAATAVSSVRVIVSNAVSSNCSAFVTTIFSEAYDVTAFGGSMSVLYIGAYASSYSPPSSSSASESTSVSDVIVSVSNASCSNCSAQIICNPAVYNAKSCGGSMSVLHIGTFTFSSINSTSRAVTAASIIISVHRSSCVSCGTYIISRRTFEGISCGGFMSLLHIGSYAETFARSFSSQSQAHATRAIDVSIRVSLILCLNCSAIISSNETLSTKSYGGSLSAANIGADAFGYCRGQDDISVVSNSSYTLVQELYIAIESSVFEKSVSSSSECLHHRATSAQAAYMCLRFRNK